MPNRFPFANQPQASPIPNPFPNSPGLPGVNVGNNTSIPGGNDAPPLPFNGTDATPGFGINNSYPFPGFDTGAPYIPPSNYAQPQNQGGLGGPGELGPQNLGGPGGLGGPGQAGMGGLMQLIQTLMPMFRMMMGAGNRGFGPNRR